MKLKIISDGTNAGTRIVDAESGEPVVLDQLVSLHWAASMDGSDWGHGGYYAFYPKVTMVFGGVAIEAIGDTKSTSSLAHRGSAEAVFDGPTVAVPKTAAEREARR